MINISPSTVPHVDSPPSVQATPSQSVPDAETQTRQEIEQFFRRVLNKILRNSAAVRSLVKEGRLTELFGIISLPCPSYNKMWRKCAAHTLITICRFVRGGVGGVSQSDGLVGLEGATRMCGR